MVSFKNARKNRSRSFDSPPPNWKALGAPFAQDDRFFSVMNSRFGLLDFLQVGELFHELFHAVTSEHHGKFRVFAFTLAHQNCAFSVL